MTSFQKYTQNSKDINKKLTRTRANWHVPASIVSIRTVNPIREVVFNMKVTPNPEKEYISLALGNYLIYLSNRIYIFF